MESGRRKAAARLDNGDAGHDLQYHAGGPASLTAPVTRARYRMGIQSWKKQQRAVHGAALGIAVEIGRAHR
jgi:hypothetical protein